MKMRIVNEKNGNCSSVVISHTGYREGIIFEEIKAGAINKFTEEELTRELNGYWATLSRKDGDTLFKLYDNALETLLETTQDETVLMQRLQTILKEIVDVYHNLDDVLEYVGTLKVTYPDTVAATFDSNENRKSRRGTYLREEYDALIACTIIIRAVMPIWIQYRQLYSADSAHNVYIDLALLDTLNRTRFIKTPPMTRLMEYVLSIYERSESNNMLGSIVAGIGSEEIPSYLLASVLCRRLAFRPIETTSDRGTLISSLYSHTTSDIGNLGDAFQALRERKESRMSDAGEEDKTGYLESFSVRQVVPDNVHHEAGVFCLNYRALSNCLDIDIPHSLVRDCLDSLQKFPIVPILPIHVYFVQYVLYRSHNRDQTVRETLYPDAEVPRRRIIQPGSIPHLNRDEMLCAMAVSQAALIHWGMRELAVYLSSTPCPVDDNNVLGVPTHFLPIEPAIREQVMRIWPNFRPAGDKSAKNAYTPYTTVNELIKEHLGKREWNLNCSKTVANHLRMNVGVFRPDQRLKNLLLELLIKVSK